MATNPVSAKPTPESVKQKVQKLYREAEIASEQLNNATAQAAAAKTTLAALTSDYQRENAAVEKMRRQVAAIVVSQYQGQSLSAASQVALSNDPSAFIQGMNVMNGISSQQAALLNQYKVQAERLDLRRNAVTSESAALSAAEAQIAKQHRKISDASAAAQAQLASLQQPQRRAVITSISGPTYAPKTFKVPPVSGMAAVAVKFALAQVGKPYVYGTAGPSTYDCSGLTMAAWGAAGVSLAHNSAAQMGEGTPVPESQLQPGDLVFYYSGISHVGMYIGNGMIVNAENPSTGVVVTGLHTMPYMGAVRIG